MRRVAEEGKGLVVQSSDEEVFPPVVIVVSKLGAHRTDGGPVCVEGDARLRGYLLKRAVTSIPKQGVRQRVVGYEDVQTPICVVVSNGNTHSFSGMRRYAALGRNVAEFPAAKIPVERVGQRPVLFGIAILPVVRRSAIAFTGFVPFHVAHDKEIEQAIVIVVEPGCGYSPLSVLRKRQFLEGAV